MKYTHHHTYGRATLNRMVLRERRPVLQDSDFEDEDEQEEQLADKWWSPVKDNDRVLAVLALPNKQQKILVGRVRQQEEHGWYTDVRLLDEASRKVHLLRIHSQPREVGVVKVIVLERDTKLEEVASNAGAPSGPRGAKASRIREQAEHELELRLLRQRCGCQ